MQKGEYQIQVAEDCLLVLFVRAIPSRSFDTKILKKIMGENYHESSARVVAWDDTALEMQQQNVRPLNGIFWGERQMVRLRWKCTGTPNAVNTHDYPTEYKVRDKRGDWHVQCDCIVLVTVRKAEEQTQAELEVESSYMDLFGVDSSQSQSQRSDPPSPPPCRRKMREERHAHTVNRQQQRGGVRRGWRQRRQRWQRQVRWRQRRGGEAQEGEIERLCIISYYNFIVTLLVVTLLTPRNVTL